MSGAGRKIVFCTSGSEGDVNPFVAVGLALKARGFDPAVATRSEFAGTVEAAGLGFHAVRPNLEDMSAELGMDVPSLWRGVVDPTTGLRFLLKRTIMPFLKASYEDVMAATEEASLVVTHSFAFAGRLAAEKRGLPWVSAVLQPFNFMSAYDPPLLGLAPLVDALRPVIGRAGYRQIFKVMRRRSAPWAEPVEALRAELGLPPYTHHPLFDAQFSPLGTLALYSPLFGKLQPDFPPLTRIVGFPFHDGGGLAPQLEHFLAEGPAPIVFTLGSAAVMDAGGFFGAALEAVRKLNARAVLLTGEERFTNLPPGVIAVAYAPHAALFPRARAVVHQGGIGTTAQALKAGRPQLIVPYMADQPDNADRVARLGVGRALPRNRYSGEALISALSTLERRETYARRARAIADVISSEDGANAAAKAIEALLIAREG